MIPNQSEIVLDNFKGRYKTYKIDFDNKTFGELIDGKEALEQGIRVALLTERYKYPIFSHRYGTDYEDGFKYGYAKAVGRLKKVIYDSLIFDERINGVDSFSFERKGTKLIVKFRVLSIYGPIMYETEVG